ncbi:hypothetical protein BJX76DRAFT_344746 [Aspergillus varians]
MGEVLGSIPSCSTFFCFFVSLSLYYPNFSYFASTEDEEIDLEEAVEPWQRYEIKETQHILYPIRIWEIRNGRCLVVHKLGFGGFSTRDVALKVMSCGLGDNETRMQDKIIQDVQGTSHLFASRDGELSQGHGVSIDGPISLPCYPGKYEDGYTHGRSQATASGLENLHRARIIHRGKATDLNDRNCMWGVVSLHHLSRSAKYEALGRPLKQNIPFANTQKQGEFFRPVVVPENLRTAEFYLGGFGLAMKLNEPISQCGYPPMQSCSPGWLHKQYPSPICDMWSYMILFAELHLGHVPFYTWLEGGLITGVVRCLGPVPEQWRGLYAHPGGLDSWVFTYQSEERLTATQLLNDPSFAAIIDRYGY